MILNLQQQLCSVVSACECLISPSLLDRYPFDALPNTDLFVKRDAKLGPCFFSMILVLDRKEGQNEFVLKDALSCEPYYHLQPSSVCQLLSTKARLTSLFQIPSCQEVLTTASSFPPEATRPQECFCSECGR